jgi:hypothetical protein
MDFVVDAGAILNVKGVTARDAADLAIRTLGDRAQFPIAVHAPSGETAVFVRGEEHDGRPDPDPEADEEKKPPQPDHGEFQKASA